MNKGEITYVKGNVCEPQKQSENELVVIPHCCNNGGESGVGVMGAGVALSLKKKWGGVYNRYKQMESASRYGLRNRLGEVCYEIVEFVPDTTIPSTVVFNMIGQDGTVSSNNPKPVKYWALLKCMQETLMHVGILVKENMKPVFHCCKFGSDLAGGNFDLILELIKETWVDRGFDVVIYEFEPNPDKWGLIPDDFFDEE